MLYHPQDGLPSSLMDAEQEMASQGGSPTFQDLGGEEQTATLHVRGDKLQTEWTLSTEEFAMQPSPAFPDSLVERLSHSILQGGNPPLRAGYPVLTKRLGHQQAVMSLVATFRFLRKLIYIRTVNSNEREGSGKRDYDANRFSEAGCEYEASQRRQRQGCREAICE